MSDELKSQLTRIERKLDMLLREKNKVDKLEEWIPEKEAAALFGWQERWLRRQATDGRLPIRNKSLHGRNFKYYKPDIEKLLTANYQ